MKTGFIGLGIMGKPMSKNLLKAGYKLVVFDVNAAAMAELASAGAETAASPREVAEKCDIVVTMLPELAPREGGGPGSERHHRGGAPGHDPGRHELHCTPGEPGGCEAACRKGRGDARRAGERR